ncbi:hemolysin activation/secretion protein [Povalibacter uvarum]|uniref:Hemolysin activation/secretion protein n=1 Tax=Povalibacter uvarum TaxID=732238 RepID=A0A841HEX1_9GAMM|nr:ShlB/FhaC/HecB family hemolysin secretion/activation protein [Povalibacter uvarum]MBB6091233.1 hemolysin activation/secretion protein [Povalibacter uvarum]
MKHVAPACSALIASLCVSSVIHAQVAPGAAAEQSFDVFELRVLGNSVLGNAQIERAITPFLGPKKSLADVEAARTALETAYKDAGYATVFVDIPEQDVSADGVVRLQVTEGRLDRIRITGARYYSNGQLRAVLPALEAGDVPHLPRVQRELEVANRQSRDRVITPVLRAGRTPGTVDVELKVEDSLPVHAAAEVNNRYTADTSQTRASVNLSYDNLWQQFHSLSLQYQTAPQEPEEARVIAATYVAPITTSGQTLAVYAVDTNSDVSTIGALSVLGAGRIYGARYILPVPQIGSVYSSVNLGFDYKDFKESIALPDTSDTDDTPIEYATWSVTYAGGARGERSNSGFSLAANFGMRGVFNDPEEFGYKRYHARPNFFYLRGSGEHEQQIFWGTRLYARVAAQYSVDPLISNEQFSIGGADSVRGYLESEALGDHGASASLEWRTPSFAQWSNGFVSELFVFAFFDAGTVAILDPLPDQQDHFELTSTGLGLRMNAFGGLLLALDGAYTLRATDRTEAYDTRVLFQVRYGF